MIGLVGGHVEPVVGPGVFEATARREALEETGLDLTDVPLHYLSSELYRGPRDQPVLTVTYAGELPAGAEPRLADPDELTAVGWWSVAELLAADNCSPWLPPLLMPPAAERSAGDLAAQPAMTRSRTVSGRSRSLATASSASAPATSVIT